jgi:hypothetical protein
VRRRKEGAGRVREESRSTERAGEEGRGRQSERGKQEHPESGRGRKGQAKQKERKERESRVWEWERRGRQSVWEMKAGRTRERFKEAGRVPER